MENISQKTTESSQNNSNNKIFDETYSLKYDKRISIFKKLLFLNLCICFIIIMLLKLNVLNDMSFLINYTFFSMLSFHVVGMIHSLIYWNDLKKTKNGESIYLKNYYPDIWKKINPYGDLIFRLEYSKYVLGKYIPKNIDSVIDRLRKDKKKSIIYFLPLILTFGIIIFGVIIT